MPLVCVGPELNSRSAAREYILQMQQTSLALLTIKVTLNKLSLKEDVISLGIY